MSSSRRHGGKVSFDDTAEQRANVVVNPQQTVPNHFCLRLLTRPVRSRVIAFPRPVDLLAV